MMERRSSNIRVAGILVLFCCLVSSVCGSKCTDISGHWQNELGSRMVLNLDKTNRIGGEYRTAVESKPGAAAIASNVTGVFLDRKDGSLLAFSVLFNHGSSMATWVGQCSVCEKKEILHTTYILKKYTSDPKAKWRSIIVNQNTFWRSEQEIKDVPTVSENMEFQTLSPKPVVFPLNKEKLHIDGKWNSKFNEEIEIVTKVSNDSEGDLLINGKWKSNTKRKIEIYGMSDTLQGKEDVLEQEVKHHKIAAVALVAAFDKGIRGWAGHVSDGSPGVTKTLETAWLEHKFSPSCMSPRDTVQFGMENFIGASSDGEHTLKTSDTFFEKIRKFFASMF